jgi:type I restriction enzyme S subunit
MSPVASTSAASTVSLAEILTPRNQIIHPRDDPTGPDVFVGLEHIEPGTGRRLGSEPIEKSTMTGRKARFRAGDIVYGYLRPYLNKVWLADFDGLCSVDQYVFRVAKDRADAAYVAWFMRSPLFLNRAPVDCGPGQLPRIRLDEITRVPLDLPSLPEQKRIAAELREQLGAAARMRAAAEQQLAAADRLAKQKLDALFKASQLESWPEASLPEVADIVAGVTLGRRLDADEVRMIVYLRVANVKDGRLDLVDLTETPATEAEIARLKLRAGDLVLTEGGDPDKLGRGSIWSNQVAECIHQNHIFRVRLNREVANPVFMSAQLGSAYGKAYFARHAKQTTGIATINQRVLKAFPLRLPPLPVQDSVAQKYEALVAVQRRLGERVRKTQELAGRLPAAVLRSAFSGDSHDS